jgi:ABC-type sugar transport system substrate-binding protein
MASTASDLISPFREELAKLGWVEGRNYKVSRNTGRHRTGLSLLAVAFLVSADGGEIAQKRLDYESLHKAVPAAETIAFLVGSTIAPFNQIETRHMQSAARILGFRLLVFNVPIDTEIAPIFATLVEHQIGAIVVAIR